MPHFDIEIAHGRNTGTVIAGVDEVGRGPLAGPVVAAAVIIPAALDDAWLLELNDSKKLTEKKRITLAAYIKSTCQWHIAEATVQEIDTFNILQATFIAMQRAVIGLATTPHHILVDGNRVPPRMPCKATPVIKGDATSLSIAAASIIAKVHRDDLMATLHAEYPHYGWDSNAGYGSTTHMAALATHGATPHHRASFAPVRDVLASASSA